MRDTPKNPPCCLVSAFVLLALAAGHAGAQDAARENRAATIEYIDHACFRVTSPSGRQVLIDPYASRAWLGYDFPERVRADAVVVYQQQSDHGRRVAVRRPV